MSIRKIIMFSVFSVATSFAMDNNLEAPGTPVRTDVFNEFVYTTPNQPIVIDDTITWAPKAKAYDSDTTDQTDNGFDSDQDAPAFQKYSITDDDYLNVIGSTPFLELQNQEESLPTLKRARGNSRVKSTKKTRK